MINTSLVIYNEISAKWGIKRMYCDRCKKVLPDDAKFCDTCGSQISNARSETYAPIDAPRSSEYRTGPIIPPPAEKSRAKVRTGKNIDAALHLAVFVPGLGHLYMKKIVRGLLFLGIGILGFLWAINSAEYYYGIDGLNTTILFIIIAAPIALWIIQYIDLYFIIKKY